MKRFAMAMIGVGFGAAALSLQCRAEPACASAAVRSRIEAGPGELTLADLLQPEVCPRWHELAAQVSLGEAPRAGSERVLDGREVRRMIEALGTPAWHATVGADGHTDEGRRIPERIVVRRDGAVKSCREIAKFVLLAAASEGSAGVATSDENVDCAAAGNIPRNSQLELLKTAWNARLQRWEFGLRCVKPEDCVPFLVWTRETEPSGIKAGAARSKRPETPSAGRNHGSPLVQRGQTASLTWEQAGIRMVLPVTCLDAGELGQWVRVRLPNASRTLRAEVVGQGTLRATL